MLKRYLFIAFLLLKLGLCAAPIWAQTADTTPPKPESETEEGELSPEEFDIVESYKGTDEDPDAIRFEERDAEPSKDAGTFDYSLYGSLRLHAIQVFDPEANLKEAKLGDGASRLGAWGEWHFLDDWNLYGRLESGFDILDTFTSKAQNDENGDLIPRLHYLSIEGDNVFLRYGKTWSTYYQVAGSADRFSIFGGDASGVYNAGTDGGPTGTGKADSAVQTRLSVDLGGFAGLRPFLLNFQYQYGEPIPHVKNQHYGSAYSISAWLQWERSLSVGLALHRADIPGLDQPAVRRAGISGDAEAVALAFKSWGERWLASLVFTRLENIETTDLNFYFDGVGVELFAQWNFHGQWWLVGGGNYLDPDDDDPQSGRYEVRYAIAGIRYTLNSFDRMLYAEYRIDHGDLFNGQPRDSEFTIGVRWDFGN